MQTLKAFKKIIWTLHNMTKEKIERYEVNDEIESSSTEVLIGDNATKWSLSFFPGGVTEDTRDYIGLCLVLVDSNSTQFDVKYSLGVVGKEIVFTEAENTGEAFRNGWGWFKFLKREELYDPNEGFLTDGKLTIFCELEITATEATESDKSALFSRELLNRNKKMLEGEVYADFKIKTADGQVLKAHKGVLAVGSTVFRDMLAGGAARKNILKVSEDASVMKRILRYIYCYEIENLKENAHDLVFAAEKYGLNKLKKMCINSMIESLTTENVLQTLLTADRLDESNLLKEKCFDLITSNAIQASDEWKLLPPKILVEIIRQLKDKNNESRIPKFNNS